MRTRMTVLVAAAVAAGCGGASTAGSTLQTVSPATSDQPAGALARAAAAADWPMFGREPSRSSATGSIGIPASAAGHLRRQRVSLPGVVDSSPIYAGGKFVVTTIYGRTIAVSRGGRILWTFTPGGYDRWKGTYQITHASPAAAGGFVYAASPDGRVHKLSLASGREQGGRWPVSVTKLPAREKMTPSFGISGHRLIVGTGGYNGDQPPYQGHIVAIDTRSGRILGITNSLCANRHRIFAPTSCRSSDSAFWSRSGAVRLPDGTWLFATGNGPFNGHTDFGDSVIRVSADARRLLGSWTPTNQADLESSDADLGSTGPVLIGGGSVLQSGKDGRLHVFALSALRRRGSIGHERQNLRTVGGGMFTAPAVWRHGKRTWVFTGTFGGTAAYTQSGGRLHLRWANGTAGTSPIVAGGLLWVYDPDGALIAYRPTSGRVVARLPAGDGHWTSPAPGHGVIAVGEGNGNDHETSGALNLYRR